MRSSLPPRAIAARHSPRLVSQKRSPGLGDGGKDSGPWRCSLVAPRESPATMTKGPGTLVYMPPEVFAEKSKYDASIDIFSVGVITIFTVGEVFPCDPQEPTYVDEKSGLLVARSELQRRSQYMRNVNDQLRACGQLRGDHPLIRLIQQCLHNLPSKRPDIREVLCLLEEARAGVRDERSERNKHQLVQALQTQPRNQKVSNRPHYNC